MSCVIVIRKIVVHDPGALSDPFASGVRPGEPTRDDYDSTGLGALSQQMTRAVGKPTARHDNEFGLAQPIGRDRLVEDEGVTNRMKERVYVRRRG